MSKIQGSAAFEMYKNITTINDFETQFLKIDKTRPYRWQYYSKLFWDMRQDLCLQEVERGWKRSFGDIPYDTRIIDSDEEVYIIFEAKHSLEVKPYSDYSI